MYRVIQQFYDAKSLQLMAEGSLIEWTDEDRIKAAVDRGLIEEVKPAKAEAKTEPKPAKKKAPAKKK